MAAGYVKLLLLAAFAVAALHHVASKECKDVVKQGGCKDIISIVTNACSTKRVKQICQKSCELCDTSIEPNPANDECATDILKPQETYSGSWCQESIQNSKEENPCMDDVHVREWCALSCGLTCPVEGSIVRYPICEDTNKATCDKLINSIGCDNKKVMPLCLKSCGLCPEETEECKDVVIKQGGCQEIISIVTNACSTKRVKQICQKSCELCHTSIEPNPADEECAAYYEKPHEGYSGSWCQGSIQNSDEENPCMDDVYVHLWCPQSCGLTCPVLSTGSRVRYPICEDTNEATCKELINSIGCDNKKVMPLCLKSCGLCPEETTETMECTDVIVKPGGCKEIFSAFNSNDGQNPCSSDSVQKVCRKSCELCSTPASGSASCSDWDPTVCKAFVPDTCVFAAIKSNCPKACGLC